MANRRATEKQIADARAGLQSAAGRRLLAPLAEPLRQLRAGGGHGNRTLHFADVVVAHLLAFFNPVIDSLRLVEQVFAQPRAQQLFKLPAARRSTMSDAQRCFDPQLLQPLVDDLVKRLGRQPRGDARLDALTREIVAVDATFFEVAARIVWALPHNPDSVGGSVQMCLHYDVFDGAPRGFTVLGGDGHEGPELSRNIRPNTLYLLDRLYQSYERLDALAAADSDFVVRLRGSANFTPTAQRPLTAEDRLAHVQHDWVATPTDRKRRMRTPTRLVEITPPGDAEPVRLLTNRLDLPAAVIGLLYQHRWQIELFFRWLKCVVQQRRFMSESINGVTLQLYVALIGTLLIALEANARPSKYDFAMLSLTLNGLLDEDEARAVMAQTRVARDRAAAWQKDYNARQKTAR